MYKICQNIASSGYCFTLQSSVDPGPSTSQTQSPADKLAARGVSGKASKVAKQRAIARGDNMAPAQVCSLAINYIITN